VTNDKNRQLCKSCIKSQIIPLVEFDIASEVKAVKPLNLSGAALLFAVPSVALAVVIYTTIPMAVQAGIPFAIAVTTQFILVMCGMAAAAWIGAHHDRESGQRITERLRLVRPHAKEMIAGVLLGIFMLGTFTLLEFTRGWLRNIIPWGPPAWFAEFMIKTHFQGIPLAGNWWPVLIYFVQYAFNILGEELWWRGYILPRQEMAQGTRAWLANGLLWNLFHWFFYWNLIPLLPSCFALPWLTQRTRNTWTAIMGHGILNGAGLLRVVMLVGNS
jgi:membrane protease YdiL (CAAX protease family)